MATQKRERVVVIGGGYAGTLAAIRLAGKARKRAQVILVSPDGVLVPRLRLHQIAAGQEIARPALPRLAGRRVEVVQAGATGIDLDRGEVELTAGRLGFDRLILATGSTIDRGAPGAAEHAHALDGLAGAAALREAFAALPGGRAVAVVGAGLTGLETVTELAEARPDVRLRLVAPGAPGGWLSPAGREHLERVLERLGIEVVAAKVTAVEPDRLLTAAGELPCDLTVWCGGFAPRPLARAAGLAVDGRGSVRVDAALRSVSHPQVLAAGDAAATGYRMSCQAGGPAGAHAADTVAAELRGRAPKPFRFGFIAQCISLGRSDGLVQWVDRADHAKPSVVTGRRAAVYKNAVTGSVSRVPAFERRFPGAAVWLGPGRAPAPEPVTA